jgi:hypothetical protein
MPRAAMSVATRILTLPDLNSASARSRCGWLLLPWIALARCRCGEQMLHDAVGAMLGAGEDQRTIDLGVAQRHRQQRLLLGLVDEGDLLLDALGGGRRRRDLHLDRV